MFRKRWQKIICLLLAFLIAGTNMQGVKVYAVESSVSKGNITEEKPEDSDVIAAENEKGFDRTESSPEAGDRANSWRYKELAPANRQIPVADSAKQYRNALSNENMRAILDKHGRATFPHAYIRTRRCLRFAAKASPYPANHGR